MNFIRLLTTDRSHLPKSMGISGYPSAKHPPRLRTQLNFKNL